MISDLRQFDPPKQAGYRRRQEDTAIIQREREAEKAGKYRGKHFTEYVEEVKALMRADEFVQAEELLLHLVDATEREATIDGMGVAPWYYERLAVLYRKQGDFKKEVEILERFAAQPHPNGALVSVLIKRKQRAQELLAKSVLSR